MHHELLVKELRCGSIFVKLTDMLEFCVASYGWWWDLQPLVVLSMNKVRLRSHGHFMERIAVNKLL